jgi:hypothetical protein
VMNFLRPLVDGGASKQEIRQERQRQHLLLTRWGFPKMLPNPPITRRQGRMVVITNGASSNGSKPRQNR